MRIYCATCGKELVYQSKVINGIEVGGYLACECTRGMFNAETAE